MNGTQKQDSFKEMLEMLKGDYNYPVKIWIWGKIIKEWAGIIIGVTIFLSIVLFIVLSMIEAGPQVKGETHSQSESTPLPQTEATLPMKDIVAFMALCQSSINKRQEIFESLMETVHSYADRKLDQKNVERKLNDLSYIFSTCNTVRGMIIDDFARIRNPFNVPEVASAFDKLIQNRDDFFGKNNEVLNPQRENEQWAHLCALCQDEVKSANKELSQILKAGESQITDKTVR